MASAKTLPLKANISAGLWINFQTIKRDVELFRNVCSFVAMATFFTLFYFFNICLSIIYIFGGFIFVTASLREISFLRAFLNLKVRISSVHLAGNKKIKRSESAWVGQKPMYWARSMELPHETKYFIFLKMFLNKQNKKLKVLV